MAYHFKNLVFEGGGVKGIAYVGSLQVLEQEGILSNIKRVGGTSAGAINAVLLGLNYSNSDVLKILKSLDFKNFMDDSWGVVRDLNRVKDEFGWYKGDFFRKWIGELIKKKTGNSETTFGDLQASGSFREIFLVGTNLSTGFSEVFSHEHTPRVCIADAVRISMSIPLFFAAKRSHRGDVYVDGGVLDNYPIKLFDRKKYVDAHFREPEYYKEHNKKLKKEGIGVSKYLYNSETLGFRLDSAKEIAIFRDHAEPPHANISDFFDYGLALVKTIVNAQDSRHLHSDDWHRTIYIDTLGVGTTDFDLTGPMKQKLVASGKESTQKYLKWFNDTSKDVAVNNPNA